MSQIIGPILKEQELFQINKKSQITIVDYFRVSRWFLNYSQEQLNSQIKKQKENILKALLLQKPFKYDDFPKIVLEQLQRQKQKKLTLKESLKDHGRKIVHSMRHYWDSYLRLVVNSNNQNREGSSDKTKKYLLGMVEEIQKIKYRWYNTDANFYPNLAQNQKQIKDQIVLIRTIINVLKNQSQKLFGSDTSAQQGEEIIIQTPKQTGYPQKIQKQKKKITEVIKISDYFKEKLKASRSQPQSPQEDIRLLNKASLNYHRTII